MRRVLQSLRLTAGALVLLLAAPAANATFYVSAAAFDAVHSGASILDFEGIAPSAGLAGVPAFPGVTIGGPAPTIADSAFVGGSFTICPCPSDYVFDNTFGGFLTFAFDPAVKAVGFNVATGATGGDVTIRLFDGLTLLDLQTVTATNNADFTTFVGWDGLGPISDLRVEVVSDTNWVNIDNLRYVPEPASLGLLAIGLLGLGARRRATA